jgi:hypothetical protein
MKIKHCRSCGETKPVEKFRRNKGCRDGVTHQCKDCHYVSQRNGELRRNFGISYAEYLIMLDAQQNCCAICGKDAEEFTKAFAVDHCHTTGKVRGLLCWHCNTSIGKFGDDVDMLERAIEYLKVHTAGQAMGTPA